MEVKNQKILPKTKIPIPDNKSKLYLPIGFWSAILAALDTKVQALSETYGFGEIVLQLEIHRGKITEVYFNDKVRIRGLLEKYETLEESSSNFSKPTT